MSVIQQRKDPGREQFWRDAIAGWKASGQSVQAYCAARGLGKASFYIWRRELARRDRAAAPAKTFVPLTVVPGAVVEVVLPRGGMVVRVPAGADAAVVARLVAALGAASC
jgi:hypothetical protein